jgi:two-component system OmpR family sensor kinase
LFSKRGLVNLKFFLIFSISIFLFTTSVIYSVKTMILETELREMQEMAESYLQGTHLDKKSLFCSYRYVGGKGANVAYFEREENDKIYLLLYYKGVEVERNITYRASLVTSLSILIYLFGFGVVILTFLYSKLLSKDSREPINLINKYLNNINEKSLRQIPKEKLPEDFHLLADTINDLINRIDTFMKYQNQLFLGTSHELKTPLAVIRLKNQVTLMKKREREDYIEAIKLANVEIDKMTRTISDVLAIGRQESAQFESPSEIDIISYLRKKGEDFQLLANSQEKSLEIDLQPESYYASIQETLLTQILQNFLQNAIKFTPQGKTVILKSVAMDDNSLKIIVIDEGIGVDEKEDIFAPFNRKGNKSGIGLGLFLAKTAADSMGAKISVKNRQDGVNGAVATLHIDSKMFCLL